MHFETLGSHSSMRHSLGSMTSTDSRYHSRATKRMLTTSSRTHSFAPIVRGIRICPEATVAAGSSQFAATCSFARASDHVRPLSWSQAKSMRSRSAHTSLTADRIKRMTCLRAWTCSPPFIARWREFLSRSDRRWSSSMSKTNRTNPPPRFSVFRSARFGRGYSVAGV